MPFSKSVALSRNAHLLFTTTSASQCSISIALHYAYAIVYTFVACCIFNYTFVDSCSSFVVMISSLVSFCIVCASTKCCSSTSSSSKFSMHTGSTEAVFGFICSLTRQCCQFLRKNSTLDVPVVSTSWIIVYANCIFSLYAFPSTHFKEYDECGNNLIANGCIFNIPFFVLFNSSSTFILLNSFASSSQPSFELIILRFLFPCYFL